MADRYWVGGSGTWNTTSTTNWSATSGGAGGASVPTAADSVFFDQASTYTVTMTGALLCLDITVSAGTVTFATGTTPSLTVSGNWSTVAATVWNSTGTVTFNATTAKTINANGITISGPVVFNAAAGSWALQSNMTVATAQSVTLTAGTLNLNNFILSTGIFASSGAVARTLAFSTTGQLALTRNNATIFDATTATNFSTTGTVYVNSTYTGATGTRVIVTGFTEAQSSGYSVSTSGTTGIVLSPSATDTVTLTGGFNNINLTGFTGTLSNTARTIYGNFVLPSTGATFTAGALVTTFGATSGTKTINTNGQTLNFPVTFNGAGGTFQLQGNLTMATSRTVTLTAGTLDLNSQVLTTNIFSSSGAVARTLAFGTGQLALNGNNATIFDVTTATNFSTTGTVYVNCTYTGAAGTRVIVNGFTEAQSSGYSVATSGTAGIVLSPSATDIVSLTGGFNNINLTGFTGTLSNTARTIYGNLVIPSTGATLAAGASTTTFGATSGTKTITTNGVLLDFPVTFNGLGGTFQLQNSLTVGSTRSTALLAGTLDLGTLTLTTGAFNSSSGSVRSIVFGAGSVILLTANNTTVFTTSTGTNLTVTGTFYVRSTYTGSTGTRTFDGGSVTQAFALANLNISVEDKGYGIVISELSTDTIALVNGWGTIDLLGFTGTLANSIRSIYGALRLPATGLTVASGTSLTTFANTLVTSQIDTNGILLDFPITLSGTTGYLLMSALTMGSTRTLTHNTGSLNLNNLTLTTGFFSSSGSSVRALSFGSTGGLVLTGNSGTLLNYGVATNLTLLGTVYINCTYTGATGTRTISTGGWTQAQATGFDVSQSGSTGLVFSSAATDSLDLSGKYDNFDLTGFNGTLTNGGRTIYGNLVIPASTGAFAAGTNTTTLAATTTGKVINTNGRLLDFPITIAGTGGGWTLSSNLTLGNTRTLTYTNTTLDLATYAITTGIFATNTNVARTIVFGNGSKIVINYDGSPGTATVFNASPAGNCTIVGTPTVEFTGGGSNTKGIAIATVASGPQYDVGLYDTSSNVSYDWNGSNVGNLTLDGTQNILDRPITIVGNYQYNTANGNTVVQPTNNVWYFAATTGTQTINIATSYIHDTNMGKQQAGTLRFDSNLTLGNTRTFYHEQGTINLNGSKLTLGFWNTNYVNTRALQFNNGLMELNSTTGGVIWEAQSAANSSIAAGTVNVVGGGGNTIIKYIRTGLLRTTGPHWNFFDSSNTKIELTDSYFNGNISFDGNQYVTLTGTVQAYGSAWTVANGANGTTKWGPSGTELVFAGTGSEMSFTPGPQTYSNPIRIQRGGSSNVTLQGNLQMAQNYVFYLQGGRLNLNDYTINVGGFVSDFSNSRTIDWGTAGTNRIIINNTESAYGVGSRASISGNSSSFNISGAYPLVELQGNSGDMSVQTGNCYLTPSKAVSWIVNRGGNSMVRFYSGTVAGDPAYVNDLTYSPVAGGIITGDVNGGSNVMIYGNMTYSNAQGNLNSDPYNYGQYTFWPRGAGVVAAGQANFTWPGSARFQWNWLNGGTAATVPVVFQSNTAFVNGPVVYDGILDFNNKTVTFPVLQANNTTGTGFALRGTGSVTLRNTGGTNFVASNLWVANTSGGFTFEANMTMTDTNGFFWRNGSTHNLNNSSFTVQKFSVTDAQLKTFTWGPTGKIIVNGNVTTNVIDCIASNVVCTVNGSGLFELTGGGTGVTKTINANNLPVSISLLETTGTVTYDFAANNQYGNLVINGVQTVTNQPIKINGNFTYNNTNGNTTFTAGANAWTFNGSGNRVIDVAATRTFDFPWIFNDGTPGNWQLANNVTLGSTRSISFINGNIDFNQKSVTGPTSGLTINGGTVTFLNTGSSTYTTGLPVTHSAGILNLNTSLTTNSATGYTLTSGNLNLGSNILTTPSFTSNNTNTRNIDFGTGKIVLNANTTSNIWNTSTITGFTVTGNAAVEIRGGGGAAVTKTILAGAVAEANSVSFSLFDSNSTNISFTAGDAVRNLIINGSQTLTNRNLTVYGSIIYNTGTAATTFTAGANTWTLAGTGNSSPVGYFSGYAPSAGSGIATVPASSNYVFPGDFTIEGWMFITDFNYSGGTQKLFGITGGGIAFDVGWDGATFSEWRATLNSGGSTSMGGSAPVNSTWTHVALVRSGSSVKLYLNGVATNGGITNTNTLGISTDAMGIGSDGAAAAASISGQLQQGYISNFRVVKGIAVYTGNFTVPTTPLTATQSAGANISAITGTETVLLTMQNATFVDNSSYGVTVTSRSNLSSASFLAGPSTWNPFNQLGTGVTRTFSARTTLDFPVIMNGVGGNYQLTTNLELGATRTLTLTNGTFDFNGRLVAGSTPNITVLTGNSTVVNTTGNANITVAIPFVHTSGNLSLGANLTVNNASGYTFTAGNLNLGSNTLTTRTFVSTGAGARTLGFGTGKISLNANANATIWNTDTNMAVSGTPVVETLGGGTTVTKVITTGAASSANSISWRFYESNGSVTYTLTNLNAFRDLTVDGLQTINPGNITVYGNFSHTNANGTTTFGASANVWTFSGSGNKTIATLTGTTYDFPWTFDGTGGNWQLLNNVSLGSTRIFTLANGNVDFNNYSLTQTSTQGITIAGGATGVASIFNTANGNNFTTAQPFTHSNGTFNLSGNVTSSNATGYTLLGGTLNLSTSALTVPSFSSSTTGARTIAFGTGKIVLNTSSGGTIWNTGTSTSLTVTGTPVVECLGGGTSITKTITPSTTLSEANTIGFSLLDNSATVTYSFTGSSVIRDLRLNGTQSLTFATLNIYGNLSHESAGTTIPANNTPWVFAATTGNRTINNLSGFTYDFPWTFGSATSTAAWTLQNDLILGSSATRALTFANGITDFNNKNISGNFSVTIAGGTPTLRDTGGSEVDFLNKPITHSTGNITLTANVRTSNTYTLTAGNIILGANSSSGNALIVDSFSSTGTGVRGINWIAPSSALYVTGNNATIFTIGVATNFTTTGVPYVVSNYSGATGTRSFVTGFSEAQAANWNVSVNGSSGLVFNAGGGTDTVSLAGNYNDINYTGLNCNIAHAGTFLYGNLTLPATGGNFAGGVNATTFLGTANRTITTNGRFYDNPIAVSKTGASLQMVDSVNIGSRTLTLNSGTLDLNNNTFTANDLSSTNSNTRALTFGTSGVITLSGSSGSVVNFTTMTGFTYAGTPRIYSTYSGGTGIRAFNFGSTAGHTPTNVMDMSFGTSGTGLVITSGTDTLDLLGGFNNVNFTGWTQGSLATSARTIYGNLTTSANATALGSGVSLTTMAGNGTQLITTNGRVIGFPIAVGNGTSNGTVRLADAYTSGSNIGNPPQLVSGTLDLNNFVFTANSFTSNGSNIRTLAFGSSGQLVLSGNSNTMADFTTMTNFVYTGTPYINSTYTGSTGTRTFIFGSSGGANPTNIFDVSRTGANGLILGTGTDSVALTGSFGDVNLSGLTQTLTNTTRTIFGNFTVPATGGTLTSGASTTNLAAPFIPVANGYSAYYVLNNNLFVSGLPFPTNGPFTVECWVNIFAMSATFSWAVSQTTNSQTFGLGVTTSGTKLKCAFAHPNLNIQSVALLDYNTWHHIAVSRDSANTFRMFVNGNLDTTSNSFTAAIIPQANCRIGGGFAGITEMYQGYITNVRVNNTAVYTASFTPPTSPLTSISGTTLLAVQNTQFVDNGPSNLTISAGATIAQNSPFAGGVSTTKTIVTNGRSLDFPINIGSFVSAPGINQLSGALTLGTANQSISLTTGTLDLNNFTLTAYNFGSSTTANRTLDFKSSGQIVLTAGGAGGGGVTVINMPTASEFRLAGNPQVRCTYNAGFNLRTFSLGNTAGFTIANVANSDNMFNFNFNGSNGIILSTSTDALVIQGQFRDFDLRNTTNSINNAVRTVYGNFYTSATGGTIQAGASAQTMAGYSGNFIIDTANRLVDFPLTINGNGNFSFSNSYNMGGRTATLTAGNVTLNNVSLFCAAFVTNGNSIRSLNFTGTTGAINLSANGATIWNSNNGANFSMSGNIIINSTYASNLGTRVFDFGNIAESSAPNVKITTGTVGFNIGTANDSVTLTGSIGDLNLTGLLATVTNSSRTVYGNITIPATGGAFTAGTTATVLGSTSGTKTIDTANRALAFPLTFNGVGGNWTLANGLNANATTVLTLANGRVNFNQQPLTFANITIAGGATGNAGLSNLNTTLAMVHTSGNLTIVSGAINSATTNSYTLTSGTLNVASSFSTGAFTNNGGNIIL